MLRFAPLAALLIATPAVAQDQSAGGSISGTLGQDSVSWTVTAPLENSDLAPSDWSDAEDGHSVRIVGFPSQSAEAGADAMILEFTTEGTPSDAGVSEAAVEYHASGETEPLMASTQNIDLTLSSMEREGDTLAVSGSVVATMTPGGSDDLIIDAQGAQTFDGNFQATVPMSD